MDNKDILESDKGISQGIGQLYLCATPIGNLEDITFRVLRILKEVDVIAAEDTRNSIKLLNHFEINTPMTSYHEYNKYDKAKTLVEKMLKRGRSVVPARVHRQGRRRFHQRLRSALPRARPRARRGRSHSGQLRFRGQLRRRRA